MKKITDFAKKPKLIKVEIDDSGIVEVYGEPVAFWMFDQVDISTYFDFFKSQADNNGQEINIMLRKIIRNERGEPALNDEEGLPLDLSIAALTKIGERLGKSKTRPST